MPLFLHRHAIHFDDPQAARCTDVAAWSELRRVVDETVGLQKLTEALLEALHREPRADLARRGGPIMSRFVSLRRELPDSDDPTVRRYTEIVDSVLEHHAALLFASLERVVADADGRHESPPVPTELGRPARWLEAIQTALCADDQLS